MIGVVSGYHAAPQSVLVQGQAAAGMAVALNTGIMLAVEINHAVKAIERHIGAPLSPV